MCRLSWNLGALTSLNPQGLSRSVMGWMLPSVGAWRLAIRKIFTVVSEEPYVFFLRAKNERIRFFPNIGRGQLKCDGTRAETRFRLSTKRTSPFKSAGPSVQSAVGSASDVVMLDTPCSGVVWRVLATHSIRPFTLHFPSLASPCAIILQLDCTWCACEICTSIITSTWLDSPESVFICSVPSLYCSVRSSGKSDL